MILYSNPEIRIGFMDCRGTAARLPGQRRERERDGRLRRPEVRAFERVERRLPPRFRPVVFRPLFFREVEDFFFPPPVCLLTVRQARSSAFPSLSPRFR